MDQRWWQSLKHTPTDLLSNLRRFHQRPSSRSRSRYCSLRRCRTSDEDIIHNLGMAGQGNHGDWGGSKRLLNVLLQLSPRDLLKISSSSITYDGTTKLQFQAQSQCILATPLQCFSCIAIQQIALIHMIVVAH